MVLCPEEKGKNRAKILTSRNSNEHLLDITLSTFFFTVLYGGGWLNAILILIKGEDHSRELLTVFHLLKCIQSVRYSLLKNRLSADIKMALSSPAAFS